MRAALLTVLFLFQKRRQAHGLYTRLHSEPVSEYVAAIDISALSGSQRGLRSGCGMISANPAGTPRFDSRRRTRVTHFHATTAARVIDPFLGRLRSAWGQGDLGRAAKRLRRRAEDNRDESSLALGLF